MKKLRIAQIINNPSVAKGGGISRFLESLFLSIDKTQIENFIISHSCDELTRIKFEKMGVTVYSLFDEQDETLIDPLKTLQSLQKIIKAIQPDIVHTHNHWADLYGRQASYRSNVPIILTTEANMIPNETDQYKASKSRLAKITDAVICVSQGVKNYAHIVDQIPEAKLRVIYYGIRLEEYPFRSGFPQPQNLTLIADGRRNESLSPLVRGNDPSQAPFQRGELKLVGEFVFVARLEPQKVPARLINAIAKLQTKGYDCHLSVIGDGSLKAECEELVKQLKLTEKIKFLGYQEKPWQLVYPDSIFVMTSDFEGFGQTITEAMATGCLCILPTLEPALEIAKDGKDALFYEAGNQGKLEDKMELALNLSSAEKSALIYQARARVEQQFDAKIMAQNYLNLYQELYRIKFVN